MQKKYSIYKSLIILFFFSPFVVYSTQEKLKFQKITEKITIFGENSGYFKRIYCKGKFTSQADKVIPIISSELEKVDNFKRLDYNSGKVLSKGIYVNVQSIETNSFYDNIKGYLVQVEDTSLNFAIQYEVSCKHLILLSSFDLMSYPNADTLVYEVNCPKKLYLSLKPDTNIHFYKIDTTSIDYYTKKYTIISIPNIKQSLKNRLVSSYEIEKILAPPIRSIVIPSGNLNGWTYFNNWFNELIKENTKLKTQSINLINSIITNKDNEEEIIKKTFNYVKTNIKYVAIENGLEGYRPRDVNDILEKKYGDCKDMANLICQILKYFNISANIAIIATVDYRYKTDFPSLSSANHAICVVKTKSNNTYYLDATNKTGRYDMPSEFIQGQDFFAINNEGGFLGIVPVIPAELNISETNLKLLISNNTLEGTFENRKLNFSSSSIRYFIENYTQLDSKSKINQYYSQLNPNLKFSNLKTEIEDTLSVVNSDISITNAISKLENKNFLLLKLLIYPHQYPKKINKGFRFITYQTSNNHFVYKINFGHNVKIISKPNDLKIDTKSLFINFNIIEQDEKTILIDYGFVIRKVELNDEEIKDFEKLSEEIQRKINSSIEYEIIN